MPLWRVRITMPPDPASREWLAAALAGQRVLAVHLSDGSDLTAEVIIDLAHDDSLGTLLSDLHVISRQVYVSSVSEPPQLAGESVVEQAGYKDPREPALVAAGPAPPCDQKAV